MAEGGGSLGHAVRALPGERSEVVEERVKCTGPRPDHVPVGLFGQEAEVEQLGQSAIQGAGLFILRSGDHFFAPGPPARFGMGASLVAARLPSLGREEALAPGANPGSTWAPLGSLATRSSDPSALRCRACCTPSEGATRRCAH